MKGRSVVISGAGHGVGLACAKRFAAAGDRLVLADSDEESVRQVATELEERGAEVSFVHADIAKRLDVHNIIAEALDAYGRIDVLANMAVEHLAAPFLETTEDEFDRVVDANLRGAFLINQAVAKQFVKQAENADADGLPGAIVNLGSVEAVSVSGDHAAFAASQGGLAQLTKAVAIALASHGVRANAVCTGAIKSDYSTDEARKAVRSATPLNRLGDPEEIAEVVFFLSSGAASYVTGQSLYVDGGQLAKYQSANEKKSQ